jgi:hypothetical protein
MTNPWNLAIYTGGSCPEEVEVLGAPDDEGTVAVSAFETEGQDLPPRVPDHELVRPAIYGPLLDDLV